MMQINLHLRNNFLYWRLKKWEASLEDPDILKETGTEIRTMNLKLRIQNIKKDDTY